MIDCNDNPTPITRHLVPEDQRLAVTAEFFGVHFIYLENTIFTITDRIASDYHGGYWDFFVLSNGGFYLAPVGDQKYSVTSFNGWFGDLSAQALGITASLTSYSHLSFGEVRNPSPGAAQITTIACGST